MSVLISPRSHLSLGMSDLCRFPTLPDSDCEELNTYPWDRPVLKEVVATLLNRPCATWDQLADLTGYSKNDVKTVVLQSPDLIMSIGRIDRKGDLSHRKSLAPFIPPGELWAMVPAAVAKMKLRKMAMVPPKGGRLSPRRHYVPKKAYVGKRAKRMRRTRVTTSRGFRLWIHDLVHTELTAVLLRFATCGAHQDCRCMVLHEAVLRQHFGWCHLSKKRAEEIRNGNPLWNMFTDCRGETTKAPNDDNILGPPRVPMDVPDGWLVLKHPIDASSPEAKEGATHEAFGVRVEVEVGGKSKTAYSKLFLQLPPQQTVIYLVPSVILRKRIQTYAKPFPHIQVPDLVIPDPGFRGRPHIDPRTIIPVYFGGKDPFPIANNLMRAAQDVVFDLYRNPKPVKTAPEKFKKNPSRQTRKSSKRRKRKARKSKRPTPKRPVTASPSPQPRTEPGPEPKATPLPEPTPKPKPEPKPEPKPQSEPPASVAVRTHLPTPEFTPPLPLLGPISEPSTVPQSVPAPETQLQLELALFVPINLPPDPVESTPPLPPVELALKSSPVPTSEPKPEHQPQPEPALPRQVSPHPSATETTPQLTPVELAPVAKSEVLVLLKPTVPSPVISPTPTMEPAPPISTLEPVPVAKPEPKPASPEPALLAPVSAPLPTVEPAPPPNLPEPSPTSQDSPNLVLPRPPRIPVFDDGSGEWEAYIDGLCFSPTVPPTPLEPTPAPAEPCPFVLPARIRESPFYAGPDELEDAQQRLRNRLAAGQKPVP